MTRGYTGTYVSPEREIRLGQEFLAEMPKNELLPTLAQMRGFELISLEPGRRSYGRDPYTLYDRWGRILHQWPEDYVPHWAEVYEVCQRFL